MAEWALPCLSCGAELRNVEIGVDNQPMDGIYATTPGNYGSRVWDSINGEFLEFNICDDCLVLAGNRGRVWVARTQKPVTYEGVLVGWATADYRPVPWRPGMEQLSDALAIDEDDFENPPPGVTLTTTPLFYRLRDIL